MTKMIPAEYSGLLAEVKERVQGAQYAALKSVNTALVGLYWDIGKIMVERQADAEHGASIAEQLSSDLREAFPGITGFSRRNIFYMLEFYLLYRDDKKVQPLVAQIASLHDARKPIGVSTYKTVKRLPKDYKGRLPTPKEISRLLEGIE